MKKENFVWLQQDKEKNEHYELFQTFLSFAGNINDFANRKTTNGWYSTDTVLKIATIHNWKKRKTAYLQHNQQIKQNATDKHTEKIIQSALKPLETTIINLTENLLLDIETKINKGTLTIPDGSEMNYLKNLVATLDKLIDCKKKLVADKDNVLTVQFIDSKGNEIKNNFTEKSE